MTGSRFAGPIEVDEVFLGGKERNKHANKRLNVKAGTAGKVAVVGAKDRETGKVSTASVPDVTYESLRKFIANRSKFGATVYTDQNPSYRTLPNTTPASTTVAASSFAGMSTQTA